MYWQLWNVYWNPNFFHILSLNPCQSGYCSHKPWRIEMAQIMNFSNRGKGHLKAKQNFKVISRYPQSWPPYNSNENFKVIAGYPRSWPPYNSNIWCLNMDRSTSPHWRANMAVTKRSGSGHKNQGDVGINKYLSCIYANWISIYHTTMYEDTN